MILATGPPVGKWRGDQRRADDETRGNLCQGERQWLPGKCMDRPGWAKLEATIRQGKVSAVVVWRIDRLGRTAKGLTALFR